MLARLGTPTTPCFFVSLACPVRDLRVLSLNQMPEMYADVEIYTASEMTRVALA